MNDFKSDAELARKGNTAAFSRLYSTVYKEMYHAALYSLRSPHDAADVVSDAVMDAFETIGKLKNADAFKAWIMKILYSKIKQKQKEYMNADTELDEALLYDMEFDFDSSDLKDALDTLDEDSRNILSLSVLGGYSSSEISRMIKLKPSAVRSKLSRIKAQLRLSLCE